MIVQKGKDLWALKCDDCAVESAAIQAPTQPQGAFIAGWTETDDGHQCPRCIDLANSEEAVPVDPND